jgi:hypothetical protein
MTEYPYQVLIKATPDFVTTQRKFDKVLSWCADNYGSSMHTGLWKIKQPPPWSVDLYLQFQHECDATECALTWSHS